MQANETINVNNSSQVENRNLCELAAQCQMRALTARIASIAIDFFCYIVVKIYEGLVAICEGFDRLITCANAGEEETPPPEPPNSPIHQPVRYFGGNPREEHQGFHRNNLPPGQGNDFDNFFQNLLQDPFPLFVENGNFDNFFQNLLQDRGPREFVVDYSYLENSASSIPTATVNERIPTAEEAQARRKEALERLKQISATQFECPVSIMNFDLDKALEKYGRDKAPNIFLIWYDYAMPDRPQRAKFKKILREFQTGERNEKYETVQHLVSKIYYILTEKKARVDKLPQSTKPKAEEALKQQIRYIITSFLNADTNCIDQTLTQLESIAIEVLATENPLVKTSVLSLLQYKASHALFQYRANLIKEILVTDPALNDPLVAAHMADIERVVKKALAKEAGMKGNILEVGAQFEAMVTGQAKAAAERVSPILCEKYEPVEYLQEQIKSIYSDKRELRRDLLQWATTYYGLDGEDELSKAVVKSQKDLKRLCTIAAVELTIPGTQLFLEAAGIIQQRKGQKEWSL